MLRKSYTCTYLALNETRTNRLYNLFQVLPNKINLYCQNYFYSTWYADCGSFDSGDDTTDDDDVNNIQVVMAYFLHRQITEITQLSLKTTFYNI